MDIFRSLSLLLFFFLCFYVSILPPTGLLLVHHSIYINQKTVNTSICSDKGLAFETSNLQSLTRQHLHVVCMSPPTGKKNPWGPQKSLSVKHRKKVQECADPRISKRLTSCALYPRPNQWRLVTVEIVSINSIEKKKSVSPSYRRCTAVFSENNHFLMQLTKFLFSVKPNLRP